MAMTEIDVPLEVRGDLSMPQLMIMRYMALFPAIVQRAVDAQTDEWRKLHVKPDGTVRAGLSRFMHGWADLWVDGQTIAAVEWKQFVPMEDPKTTIIPAGERSHDARPES